MASKLLEPEAEPPSVGRRQHESSQTDRSDETFRRGIRDSTVTRAGRATGETVLVPSRNRWRRVGHIWKPADRGGTKGPRLEGQSQSGGVADPDRCEPALGGGHHLYPAGRGVRLPGRDPGCVFEARDRMAPG